MTGAPTISQRTAEYATDELRPWQYHFPTDAQMVEAIAQAMGLSADDLQDGRRMNRVNHVIQMVQLYHRQARATGDTSGYKKRTAVAAAMWPDVHCNEDMHRKSRQLRTWELIAERAGLLQVWDGRGARALGWALLDGWQRYAGGLRGYSSVGEPIATAPCEARRRREGARERRELRVRPHCRRVGNKTGAVGRLLAPPPSSKRLEKSTHSGLEETPTGISPTFDLLDAPVRGGRPTAGATPDGEQRHPEARAREAERLFAATFGPPAAGPLRLAGPLLAALDELERQFARMAELNGRPVWPDAGLSYLEQLIGGEAEERRWEERPPPRHVGFFVKPLLAEARRTGRKYRQHPVAKQRRATGAPGSRPPHRRGSGARRSEP
jgi:hypothetical protein